MRMKMPLKKKLLVSFIIIAIFILVSVSNVFSIQLTSTDTSANLLVVLFREGGTESSGTLNEDQELMYDQSRYAYTIDSINIHKIIEESEQSQSEHTNAIYCLDANKTFPGVVDGAIEYNNVADFFDSTDINVKALNLSASISSDSTTWITNYKALNWLFNYSFLEKQTPELKDDYLEKAFADYTTYDMETVKALLTDDDIDVVQQYAIWHFTNGDTSTFAKDTMSAVILKTEDGTSGSYQSITGLNIRQELVNHLYNYLVTTAEENSSVDITYPQIVNKTTGKTTIENGYYVAGPFKVSSGNANVSINTFKLVDQNENEINRSNYKIFIDGVETSENINNIYNQEYYIHIPTTNTDITSLKLLLNYSKYETDATLWKTSVVTEGVDYQPVILLTRNQESVEEEQNFEIERVGQYNLKINKTDTENGAVLNGAKFSIKIGDNEAQELTTNAQGLISIDNIEITEEGTEVITITETESPKGYKTINGTLELEITKTLEGNKYKITEISPKTSQANMTSNLDKTNQLITVDVENEKITGNYNLKINKTDSKDGTVLSGAKFSVKVGDNKAQELTTDDQGIINIDDIDITEDGTEIITITETEAPNGYKTINGTLELEATKIIENDEYKVSEIKTKTAQANMSANFDETNQLIIVDIENEKMPRCYNLKINKTDIEDGTVLSGAKFSVKIGDNEAQELTTNDQGIISIDNIEITEEGTEPILITEKESPNGYKVINGTLELEVTKIPEGNEYKVSEIKAKTAQDNMTVSFDETNQLITIDVENEKITGKYELEIEKTDEKGNTITDLTTKFDINEEEKETKQGIVEVAKVDITKDNVDEKDTYTIVETQAPDEYSKFEGTIKIEVEKELSEDGTKYEVKEATMTVIKADETTYESEDIEIVEADGTTKIIVKVKNYEKIDLSLRKFITAISKDETFETEEYLTGEESREPEIDIENLDNGASTTAKYNHTKEVIKVEKGDYILYTLRVYNEGKTNGYASEITDYLPEGLEFVTDAEANEVWDYDETTRKLTTNEKYVSELLKAHEEGKELEYQDLEVVCKVSDTVKEDTNIINIAEITESKHEDGTIAEDIDSETDNLDYPEDVPGYEGGTDTDKTDEYIPGQEDDDDFERIIVESEPIENYNILINKCDSKDNTILLSGAEFNIKIGDNDVQTVTTDENGNIEINDIEIAENDTDVITITEVVAPNGYKLIEGTLELEVTRSQINKISVNITKNIGDCSAIIENNKVKILIPNETIETIPETPEITGKYELEIEKTDEKGNTITDLTTKFDINGEKKETKQGIVEVAKVDITKDNVNEKDTYTIVETQAPDEYSKFEGTIKIEVEKELSEDGTKYEVKEATMTVIKADGTTYESEDIEIVEADGTTKIIVKVKNYEKIDLSLRKFIRAISKDETFETEEYLTGEESREPEIDIENLDNGASTTAKYNHTKEVIKVEKGDYILYTLRVYNEGKTNGYASEITDYLPEGLEFVTDAEANKIWDYDETTRKLTTNEKYVSELLKAHEEGKELEYQDLEVVCKVSDTVKEDTNIVNIAEITESKHGDGTIAEDIDSETDNLDYPEDVPGYEGGTDQDKTDEYIPGQEDDDDFERIIIESKEITGKYELEIVKTDGNGKTITDLTTKFDINGEEKETKKGIVNVAEVTITKDNVDKKDTYIIKETQAPDEYSKFEGTIKLEVEKSLSEDGTEYTIEKTKLTVMNSEGKEYSSTEKYAKIEVTEENGTTKIKVKVINYEIPEVIETPKQEETQQVIEQKTEIKNVVVNQEVTTPSTGDMLPIIAVGLIEMVVIINIFQIIIFKKKKIVK